MANFEREDNKGREIMSRKESKVNVRIDSELKRRVSTILHNLGLSESEAIRMFYKQIEHRQGLPFEVKIANEDTHRAIRDVRNREGLTSYNSIEEYFESKGL